MNLTLNENEAPQTFNAAWSLDYEVLTGSQENMTEENMESSEQDCTAEMGGCLERRRQDNCMTASEY